MIADCVEIQAQSPKVGSWIVGLLSDFATARSAVPVVSSGDAGS